MYLRRLFITLIALLILLGQYPLLAKQRADSTLMSYLTGEGLVSYDANEITLYTNGHEKFCNLIADIDQAKKKIWIEYFIFANDSIGTLVMNHLIQAAKRGCDVRIVTDYYKDRERHFGMSRPEFSDSLAQFGVDFQMFDRYKYISFKNVARDHRKIVAIDDYIGYIGGLNIADYYINGNPAKYGGWRDAHIRITGPAVEGLASLFHKQYVASGGKRPYTYNTNSTRNLFDSEADHPNTERVVYFERSRENRKKKAETRNAIIAAFDAAQDTIRLVSPYLIPTHTVRQALIRALDRGVHVEILFSKVGDIELISSGNYHFAQRLLRHGAHIYLYRGDFHHSKIIMVDDQFCMVGSANLNSRSLKWDYEASAFIFGSTTTNNLNRVFARDKQYSDILSYKFYHENYSLLFLLKGWFADRILTPIL